MEWDILIVGGGILLAFVAAIVTPILKLNTTLVKLGEAIKNLRDTFTSYEDSNTSGHRAILEKLGVIDCALSSHTERITRVEESVHSAHKRIDEHIVKEDK